jgi:UDP-glucuronate 4-epimerase
LADGHVVVGLDNLNDYYDPTLKQARLDCLSPETGFRFFRTDLCDRVALESLFDEHAFGKVVHLAAQAGVRYSLENPRAYIDSNIVGFLNILENCRRHRIGHLVYASSSSVYGLNEKTPFSEDDPVDHPASLYAATKKSNELLAHTYSHLFGLPTTGLRFFTVYGPWGRPDMAIFKFTKAILEGRPIDVYNNGVMKRDFTYIDDIVEGVVRTVFTVPVAEPSNDLSSPASAKAPFRVYNIGNNKQVELTFLISALESILGLSAKKNFLPMQPGDVLATYANVDRLQQAVGFAPATDLETGLRHFVEWYREYYVIRGS